MSAIAEPPTPSTESSWRWNIFPELAADIFSPKPDEPLPIWASKNVVLDRRVTTRPGLYDPEEFPWTWEFQEIIRTRQIWEKKLDDGSMVIVDPNTEGATPMTVRQCTVMKSSVAGFTEGALNGIRYAAAHDPQNVIFAIDNRVEAGNINEIRLQPSLRRLGQKIFTDDDDDAGKFLLKLQRMLVYFLGSYSSGAFANKMAELAISDEREEHAAPTDDTSSTENLRSRVKSSPRGLLIEMSKPKLSGGPIASEHAKGTMHVPEVPCPHCGKHQQLTQDNMKFSHCKNEIGEWDLDGVLRETFFECVHCKKPIEERSKRWMNDRSRRRWLRTNFKSEPYHVSFHISDFYSYLITWGELAVRYIKSKGDPVARQGYRNHHEGLPWEIHESRTEISDLLLLRDTRYKRGTIPWKPLAIILGADVGLEYVKWGVYAFRRSPDCGDGECAAIDWGKDLHPDDIAKRIANSEGYLCLETKEKYPIGLGVMDAKYRRIEVHQACLRIPRRLYPSAGVRAGLSIRSISFNHPPQRPRWFGVIVYNDDDAKGELYTDRIGAWSAWIKHGSAPEEKPLSARLWLPSDVDSSDTGHAGSDNGYSGKDFMAEHTREHLIEIPPGSGRFTWKRKGANEGGDLSKVACMTWRFFMLGAASQPPAPELQEEEAVETVA